MSRLNFTIMALLFLISLPAVMAGPRANHWSGFDVGTGTTPFPSVAGVALGFNIGDDARVSSGIGTFVHWASYSLDGKFFLADTPWAGFFGLGMTYMSGARTSYLGYDLKFDRAFIPYLQTGLDFQSDIGVHVQFSLAGAAPSGTVIILPGLAIGWYF